MSELRDFASVPLAEIGAIIDDPTTSSEVLSSIATRTDLNCQHQDGLIIHPNVTEAILRDLRPQAGRMQRLRLDRRLRRLKVGERNNQPTECSDYEDYGDYSDNYNDWNDWYGHR